MDEEDLQLERAITKHATDKETTHHKIHADGRVDISFKKPLDRALGNKFFARVHRHHRPRQGSQDSQDAQDAQDSDSLPHRRQSRPLWRRTKRDFKPPVESFEGVPPLNIAILVVGSRGDVQPFVALGKVLMAEPYNHRVRIVTHPVFKGLVEENGLEFFSMGGDPEKLMSYAVRNPGIMPSYESIRAGDVGARRADIAEMLEGAWLGCTAAGTDGNTLSSFLDKHDWLDKASANNMLFKLPKPFVADAIIANPPSYAALHIAEKLAIPLHMMFTMPWSPTTAFPHPLANLDSSKIDAKVANYLSYIRLELLTWQGLEDLINRFREKTLFLDPINTVWGSALFPHLKVPFTYCWSPALIPKPADWGSHISVSGFFFLGLASSYQPDPELLKFLDAGPPPVYIGFGSIVVDDPKQLNTIIFEAIEKTGVRALVSRGWAKLGIDPLPSNVFLLGNVPHDWLFPRCCAVVHHGGAGTTAIGIALGKPTVIVPFFGDQGWWAGMVARSGAGPQGVPYKQLTSEILADNITAAMQPEMRTRAEELAAKISHEDGNKSAAEFFHQTPQMRNLRCFLYPERPVQWRIRRTNIQISGIAAGVLVRKGLVDPGKIKLIRRVEWLIGNNPQGPLVALAGTFQTTFMNITKDATQFSRDLRGAAVDHHNQKDKPKANQISIPDQGDNLVSKDIDSDKVPDKTPTSSYVPRSKSRTYTRAVLAVSGSTMGHLASFPVALLYNLANGFHNFPAFLFKDPTVRVQEPIIGLGSGLRVGGRGFIYGIWDAVTGLVVHPVREVRANENGTVLDSVTGFAKGTAQGLGGLVFKSAAAGFALPGYGMKGIQREIEARMSDQTERTMKVIKGFRRLAGRETGDDGDARDDLDAAIMWEGDIKGSHANAYVKTQLAWGGFREWHGLVLDDPEKAEEIEKIVLERWAMLQVPQEFTK